MLAGRRINKRSKHSRPLIVSFSGIDGAGKTTQIERLIANLHDAALRVRLIRFWDDIATLRSARENVGFMLFKGERGIGALGKPVNRRDKNVQSWYMLPIRLAIYSLDALRLRWTIARLRKSPDIDVAIFDRYVYDELANLDTRNLLARLYSQLLLSIVPRPDLPIVLDADPAAARERKPEYPLDFMQSCRQRYLQLSSRAGLIVIPAGTADEVEAKMQCELAESALFCSSSSRQLRLGLPISQGQSVDIH